MLVNVLNWHLHYIFIIGIFSILANLFFPLSFHFDSTNKWMLVCLNGSTFVSNKKCHFTAWRILNNFVFIFSFSIEWFFRNHNLLAAANFICLFQLKFNYICSELIWLGLIQSINGKRFYFFETFRNRKLLLNETNKNRHVFSQFGGCPFHYSVVFYIIYFFSDLLLLENWVKSFSNIRNNGNESILLQRPVTLRNKN